VTPEDIERARLALSERGFSDVNQLCELALDGLRFRAWIEGASYEPAGVARALAYCLSPQDYRTAIDGIIVANIRRRRG
jgi:hypothetical protein